MYHFHHVFLPINQNDKIEIIIVVEGRIEKGQTAVWSFQQFLCFSWLALLVGRIHSSVVAHILCMQKFSHQMVDSSSSKSSQVVLLGETPAWQMRVNWTGYTGLDKPSDLFIWFGKAMILLSKTIYKLKLLAPSSPRACRASHLHFTSWAVISKTDK